MSKKRGKYLTKDKKEYIINAYNRTIGRFERCGIEKPSYLRVASILNVTSECLRGILIREKIDYKVPGDTRYREYGALYIPENIYDYYVADEAMDYIRGEWRFG